MVRRTLILFCGLFWLASVGEGMGVATAAPLEAYATALTTADQQHQALEQMRALADPSYKDLLMALKEGALYNCQDKLLILGDSGVFKYLAGQALLDASGQPFLPDDAVPVPLEERSIPLVQRVLDAINLTDPDPRARRSAALKLGNLRDSTSVGSLEQALVRESDASVRPVMVEALHNIFSTPTHRRAAKASSISRPPVRSQPCPCSKALSQTAGCQRQAGDATSHHIDPGLSTPAQSRRVCVQRFQPGLDSVDDEPGASDHFRPDGGHQYGPWRCMSARPTAYVVQECFAAFAPARLDYFFFAALPLSLLLVGAVGLCLEQGLLRFLYGRPLESLLATWGIVLILQQGIRLSLGDKPASTHPPGFVAAGRLYPGWSYL